MGRRAVGFAGGVYRGIVDTDMVALAHIAVVTPRRCGLYETTRELVVGLRAAGIDSRIYDPTKAKNKLHPDGDDDRGAVFCDLNWVFRHADLLVNHSGLGAALEECDTPVIQVCHGRPRSSFLLELKGSTPIYSYHHCKNRDPRFQAVITFWPEHVPYHRVMWPDTPVYCVQPPVDLGFWTPNGPSGYRWGGAGGVVNVICTDMWREDIDPFVAVNAFALHARSNPGWRIHLYGASKNQKGWAPLLKRLQDDGSLGQVRGMVTGLENVYRAADLLLTPHVIDTRAVREAMACGCPVQRVNGSECTWDALGMDRAFVRSEAERRFDPARTAEQFLSAIERFTPAEVLNGCV